MGKNIQFDPYLESSFFWKSQVGRNTILTSSHMFGSENQNFLYYHGVANNLGMTDLSCYWLDGEIRRIWNCTGGVFWKFIQDGGPQKLAKLSIIYFISLILYILYLILYVLYVILHILYIILYILLYFIYYIYYILYIWGLLFIKIPYFTVYLYSRYTASRPIM